MRIWVAALAVAISAVAFYFCTGFNHVWWAAWIAPIPVLFVAFRSSGWIARTVPFVAYFLGIVHITPYLRLFIGWPMAISVAILTAWIFAACVMFARNCSLRMAAWAAVWAFPIAWTTYEFLFSLLGPWGTILNYAYSQLDFPPVLQIASIAGIWGISFTIMLFASTVAMWNKRAIAAAIFVAAVLTFGIVRLQQPSGPGVPVGLITADADLRKSWNTQDPQEAIAIANAWSDRIRKAGAEGARVIVLPEKALGITPADQQQVYAIYSQAAQKANVTVVAGFNFIGIHPPRNIAVVFQPDGGLALTYDKHHMLQGPETPYLVGNQPAFFTAAGYKWGAEICKDMDYPAWSREYGENGVRFMAVPAWDFVEDDYFHGRIAQLRGVENGFTVVHAAQEGLLYITDAYGRVIAQESSGSGPEAMFVHSAPGGVGKTMYARFGDWFAWLNIFFMVTLLATRYKRLGISLLSLAFVCSSAWAQTHITTPKEQFGFNLGDDYQLTNYTQLSEYWHKLASESDRMKLVSIGKTAEGRDQHMAVVTSPENMKQLDQYKEISRKLALAQGLSDDEAHALAREGKAVIWIDGGLHASEVECAQALSEMLYQMVSRTDPETMRFLNDDIILFVQDNPDGQELVANWYMRNPDAAKRSDAGLPRLWHKYIGHDNNRDFFMCNMPESTNINRVLYLEWFPQIMYNHHQTGPPGAVIFMPPFRDPFNYHFDPLIMMELDQVGAAMHARMEAEDKPGAGMRSAATYSTWYNGGLRTTTYFHNIIGLLTEIIGSPTPIDIPLVPAMQLARNDLPFPIAPQKWHLRESIEYSLTANRAVLDYGSRYRETLLFNIYRMGKNSIDRGNRDSWTTTPHRIEALEAKAAEEKTENQPAGNPMAAGFGGARGVPVKLYETVLHDPSMRDPRGYIIPSDSQPDLPTTIQFLNALLKNGVAVDRATADFKVNGKAYPEGSYVVRCAQAFRPHVLDMFEPQDHPNDFRYPGGPPIPPYDATGYTLAFQMGVKFDRILDGFDGPFEPVTGLLQPPPGTVTGAAHPAGYVVSHRYNNSFILTNRLFKEKCNVYWLNAAPGELDGKDVGAGALWIPASPASRPVVERAAKELGINAYGLAKRPAGADLKLKPVRVALYDQYGGLMPSGWTRWLFEQFEFPFKVVYPQDIDSGVLKDFDVIVFTDGAIRAPSAGGRSEGFVMRQPKPEDIPAEYRGWLGRITPEKTIPQIKKFVESGGAVIAIGSSTSIATSFNLPLSNALTERTKDAKETPLPPEKFYIPGSLLTLAVNNTDPLAYGMPDKVDVFFDNSPSFKLNPDASLKGTSPVAWYPNDSPLHSGWAWGQQYLKDTVAVAESNVGSGKVFLLAPEVAFRGQPHATFKFIFNGIYYGPAKAELR